MSLIRSYLNVSFDNKDFARELGAKWDNAEKYWYVPEDAPGNVKSRLISEFGEAEEKVILQVPFDKKDEAKKLGAWWDRKLRKWYIPRRLVGEKREQLIEQFLNKEKPIPIPEPEMSIEEQIKKYNLHSSDDLDHCSSCGKRTSGWGCRCGVSGY